jgi:hypothetical protein
MWPVFFRDEKQLVYGLVNAIGWDALLIGVREETLESLPVSC